VPNLKKVTSALFDALDWAASSSSSALIALIKLLLLPRRDARIGVRAAGKQKTRVQKGRRSAPEINPTRY
jgi:hypothetical protein